MRSDFTKIILVLRFYYIHWVWAFSSKFLAGRVACAFLGVTMKMRIGLIGFGRTGSVVAKEIVSDPLLSLEWVCKNTISKDLLYASHALGFDKKFAPFVSTNNLNKKFLSTHPVDIVVDFSSGTASALYYTIAESGSGIVSAISNYSKDQFKLLTDASAITSIMHSPNITLGINWLMIASKLLQKIIPNADIEVVEEHFRAKKDVSGTALKLASHLNLDPKEHVNSIRVGGIIGKHEVIFGLPYQTLRLTHESINRSAFGTGAIFASKWLKNKTSGLYTMENAIQEKFLKNIIELNTVT
jgi:4-hydroxy-tetrahydrodipicolinate reductase